MTDVPTDTSPELALAVEAARRAGQIIAERFCADNAAARKAGGYGEVTRTDGDAEAAILAVLRDGSRFPVLSEEAGGTRDSGQGLWIVDPLDGTTNFSRGLPLCAVAIALMRDRRVELGVIYHPLSGDCYRAERGRGAFCNGQRLRVSAVADPDLAVLFLTHGYPAADRARFGVAVQRFSRRSYPRTLGSTAVELSYLAAGRGDGWICSGDELWDFAAGTVLVEEAGGRVSDWRGREWDGESLFAVVSNGAVHDHLVATVADLQE